MDFRIETRRTLRLAAAVLALWLCANLAACTASLSPASPEPEQPAAPAGTESAGQATASPTAPQPSQISTRTPPDAFASPAATPTAAPKPTLTQPPATLAPPCRETQGRFDLGQIETPLLREPLDFRVYLPPCYQQAALARLPVLYLIHGQSYNDDQWERLGAAESADALISSAETAPFIMVMPRDRRWSQPDDDMFGRAVIEELIPYIDQRYRTCSERRCRAIGGLSRGGGWAVHLGLSEWELFGAIGAHSLALFHYDSARIPGWLEAIPPEQMPRIYMDMADHDRMELVEPAEWFENLLTERGIPHEWYLFPGYHEEKYWAAHVEQYLRWYASEW